MGASEVLALATRLGLDPSRTLDVIESSSGQSWIGSHRLRRALAGDEAPQAHMTLLAKDSRLAEGRGAAQRQPGPGGRGGQRRLCPRRGRRPGRRRRFGPVPVAAAGAARGLTRGVGAGQPPGESGLAAGLTGKRTVNSAPGAADPVRGWASPTTISASCCCAISCTIARPSPVPSTLVPSAR